MKFAKYLKRLLSINEWIRFFKILTKKERIVFCVFFALFTISLVFLISNFYFENTKISPTRGGTHTEAVVGQPRFINPIYSRLNDIDRDLVELLFSGLMKHKNGKIVPDLAKYYNVSPDGKIYEFHLRENIFWHNKEKLTADDVIFTIETIQNPDFKSPERINWLGIRVEKISEYGIRFILDNPYAGFLERATLNILPSHIWKDVSARAFPFSLYNLQPIGSGPFKFKNLKQRRDKAGYIESLTLIINPNYFNKKPFIDKISFLFFETEQDIIKAAHQGRITGFSIQRLKNLGLQNQFSIHQFIMPRYFAVFFNQEKSEILADIRVRQALNYGTNKQNLIDEILTGQAKIVNSPILPNIFGFENPLKIYQFNPKKAKQLLEAAGFIKKENGVRIKIIEESPVFQFTQDLRRGARGREVKELQRCLARFPEIYPEGRITSYFGSKTKAAVIRFQERYKEEILTPHDLTQGTGVVKGSTRVKLNQLCHPTIKETLPLRLSLTTINQPFLIEVASQLKNQWQELGVELEIKTYDINFLKQEIIRPRNYEMLLFGKILGIVPDPFPFWHSTQARDPGLNLSLYKNRRVDELLEKARQTLDAKQRRVALEEFQNILIKDAPAIFLFNPSYLYFVSQEVKGVLTKIITDPSKRFNNIENWYIETKRVWK